MKRRRRPPHLGTKRPNFDRPFLTRAQTLNKFEDDPKYFPLRADTRKRTYFSSDSSTTCHSSEEEENSSDDNTKPHEKAMTKRLNKSTAAMATATSSNSFTFPKPSTSSSHRQPSKKGGELFRCSWPRCGKESSHEDKLLRHISSKHLTNRPDSNSTRRKSNASDEKDPRLYLISVDSHDDSRDDRGMGEKHRKLNDKKSKQQQEQVDNRKISEKRQLRSSASRTQSSDDDEEEEDGDSEDDDDDSEDEEEEELVNDANEKKRVPCPFSLCTATFTKEEYMRTHMRVHLCSKPYWCKWPGCDWGGEQLSNAVGHVKRCHLDRLSRRKAEAKSKNPKHYLTIIEDLE